MQFYINRNNVITSLSNGAPLEVVSVDGISIPDTDVITDQGPLQQGATDIDYRLQQRVMTLVLQVSDTANFSYESARDLINRVFSPTTQIKFGIVHKSGTTYEIAARCTGAPNFASNINQEILLRAGLRLVAADPLFYNPVQRVLVFALLPTALGDTVPSFVPSGVGPGGLTQTNNLDYAGTFTTYPLITINGPITNPKLTNKSNGAKIEFTGLSLSVSDVLVIDLRYGRKVATLNGSTNVTGLITTDSKLTSFGIYDDSIATNGLNAIEVIATGVSSSTQISIAFFERFIGV